MFKFSDVLPRICALIDDYVPLHYRVIHVASEKDLYLDYSASPVTLDNFFPSNSLLSDFDRTRLYLHIKYGKGCQDWVFLLAVALRHLLSAGVKFDQNITDVLVFNCCHFDVSDVIGAVNIHSAAKPENGISSVFTYASQKVIRDLGPEFCAQVGCGYPDAVPTELTELQDGFVPHWWIAVTVDVNKEEKQWLHIDICGAAYEHENGLQTLDNGRVVSLYMFRTPAYSISQIMDKKLKHKFEVLPTVYIAPRKGPGFQFANAPVVYQPHTIRHFRALQRDDDTGLALTDLDTFLGNRSPAHSVHNENEHLQNDAWVNRVDEFITKLMLDLPRDVNVEIRGLKNRADMNGLIGATVQIGEIGNNRAETAQKCSKNGRIAVSVYIDHKRKNELVSIRPENIKLITSKKKTHSSHADLTRLVEIRTKKAAEITKSQSYNLQPGDTDEKLSKKEQKMARRLLSSDADVQKVLQMIESGKLVFSTFADDAIVRGIRKMVKSPLCHTIPLDGPSLLRATVVARHPTCGKIVFSLINKLNEAKNTIRNSDPSAMGPKIDVSAIKGTVYEQELKNVYDIVWNDGVLMALFQELEDLGYYMHPVKQYLAISSS